MDPKIFLGINKSCYFLSIGYSENGAPCTWIRKKPGNPSGEAYSKLPNYCSWFLFMDLDPQIYGK